MKPIEWLATVEEIKQLKARYFRSMDSKDWAVFESVFAPDAVLDMRNGRGEMLDPDAIVHGAGNIAAFVRNAVHDLTTVHHGHMPEIQITSPTAAVGIWAMEDVLRGPEGSKALLKSLHGYGHYHEVYERFRGSWRIKSLKLTRLRVDIEYPASGSRKEKFPHA